MLTIKLEVKKNFIDLLLYNHIKFHLQVKFASCFLSQAIQAWQFHHPVSQHCSIKHSISHHKQSVILKDENQPRLEDATAACNRGGCEAAARESRSLERRCDGD